jgi:hypothetical protein
VVLEIASAFFVSALNFFRANYFVFKLINKQKFGTDNLTFICYLYLVLLTTFNKATATVFVQLFFLFDFFLCVLCLVCFFAVFLCVFFVCLDSIRSPAIFISFSRCRRSPVSFVFFLCYW